jgi:hypothetical protein
MILQKIEEGVSHIILNEEVLHALCLGIGIESVCRDCWIDSGRSSDCWFFSGEARLDGGVLLNRAWGRRGGLLVGSDLYDGAMGWGPALLGETGDHF